MVHPKIVQRLRTAFLVEAMQNPSQSQGFREIRIVPQDRGDTECITTGMGRSQGS